MDLTEIVQFDVPPLEDFTANDDDLNARLSDDVDQAELDNFGIIFDDVPTTSPSQLAQYKLDKIVGKVMPFLFKLTQHPERAQLQWTNRSEVVTKFIEELHQILELHDIPNTEK
jgi:hypothetical protein